MGASDVTAAIIKYKLWVHPAGRSLLGWTASSSGSEWIAWNKPTLYAAVEDVVRQIEAAEAAAKEYE